MSSFFALAGKGRGQSSYDEIQRAKTHVQSLAVPDPLVFDKSGSVLEGLRVKEDSPAQPMENRKSFKKGFVERVIDGDTLELKNGKVIRYAGIDTPEIKKLEGGKWVKVFEPYGVPAFRLNQKLVDQRTVYFELDEEKTDEYERILAYLYVDGMMVNALLVEQGLARVTLYPPNLKYAELFLKMQRQAWEGKRGIWSDPVENIKAGD